MLSSACFATTVTYNYINPEFSIEKVIEEKPIRGMALAKRRLKKLGFFRVGSQVAFSFLVVPFLGLAGKKRVKQIKSIYHFDETPVAEEKIIRFETVNDQACIDLLKELNPAIVIVSGTRILSKKLLDSCPAVFINMHAGITPQYRGVHGGYWAMANKDPEHCGVTIHLVDKGIDTGAVLFQKIILVQPSDNYTTYPFLQLGEGLPLMKKAVQDANEERLQSTIMETKDSKLYYHPTIWQYFFNKSRKRPKTEK